MQAVKKIVLASAIALTGMGVAQAATVIYANVEPPALRVETVPAPRAGYVWAPGYWGYHHRKYVWTNGHYIRERHGYTYRQARWEHEGDRWRYYGGGWDRH